MNRKYFNFPGILIGTLIIISSVMGVSSADNTRDIIMNAMKDEMQRNLDNLTLENMKRPFFISYNIYDVKTMEVTASLGSIISAKESNHRNHNVRVMVGDYELNDENFRGTGLSSGSSMIRGSVSLPLEDSYDGIRRALWIVTDNLYKSAAELYEHKVAAMKQQTISEEAKFDDFSRQTPVVYSEPARTFEFNQKKWEKAGRDISGVFNDFPDIYSSQVRIFFYMGEMYFVNSEGTEVVEPLTLAAIQVNGYTQAVDGDPLSDHLTYYQTVPDDFPRIGTIKKAAVKMAEKLTELRNAEVFDDSYFGPVLFENQASAEFFSQRLFAGQNSLIGFRRPISGNSGGMGYRMEDRTLDDRIGRRILSRDISIKAMSDAPEVDGKSLIGSFKVDNEGVMPPTELSLVENGILKTLLNNRVPSPKVRQSNGHLRPIIGNGYWTSSKTGPGIVSIESSEGKSDSELKKELLTRVKEEGLDYGIVVRKLKPHVTGAQFYDPMVRMTSSFGSGGVGSLTPPVLVYKVYVEDEREELVRSVKLGAVGLSTLRHIAATSKKQFHYNTLSSGNYRSGVPATFIVPEKMLLEELEVKREKRDYTPKLPVVGSPLAKK